MTSVVKICALKAPIDGTERYERYRAHLNRDHALSCSLQSGSQGPDRTADLLWRAALNRAAELSRTHSPKLGPRSLDVLHVACALELGARFFLTFDERQQKLARAVGLKVVVPA